MFQSAKAEPRPISAHVDGSGTAVREKLSIAMVSRLPDPDEVTEAKSLKYPLEILSTSVGPVEIDTDVKPQLAESVIVTGDVVKEVHAVPLMLTCASQVVVLGSGSTVKKSKLIVEMVRPVLLKLNTNAAPGSPIEPDWR